MTLLTASAEEGHYYKCAGPVKVLSKKQPLVASHTQEAEYIEMAIGINEARVAINFMTELGFRGGVTGMTDPLTICSSSV